MSPDPTLHPDEALQELVDGRLTGDQRVTLEQHLATCERCSRLHQTLLSTGELLRASRRDEPVPSALAAAVRSAVDGAAASGPATGGDRVTRERASRPTRRRAGWCLLAAAALVLAAGIGVWLRRGDAVDDLIALHAGAEPEIVSPIPAELEAAFAARLPFRPRVLDLAMMELALRGGGVGRVAGEPAAWMVYDGPQVRLVCVMWRGRLEALPATAEQRRHDPFTFRIYRRAETTVVTWQEGELVCALVGKGDPEAVLALAMAKAMPVV
jgi:anti-sigma factor RsiW